MPLIFYAEYTESVVDILSYPQPTMGPPWLGPEKIFKIKFLRRLDSAILRLVFANIVNAPFNYAFFQPMYKQYAALNSPKTTPAFDDIMTQFCLNFLNLQKLGGGVCYDLNTAGRSNHSFDIVYSCLIYREIDSLRFNAKDLESPLPTKKLVFKRIENAEKRNDI